MTNNYFSDKERVEISKKSMTDDLALGYNINLDNNKMIGNVFQIYDKLSGEQSFVITNHYVPLITY